MKITRGSMITEPTSFAGLFAKTDTKEALIDRIEIPMLQRDYAQGRKTPKIDRVRKNFLEALHSALLPDSQPIRLDFIYGSIEKSNENQKILVPLDGQQRLTTLFLLHWYAANKENISKDDFSFLNRFTYQTRFSSRDFCSELIKFKPDLATNAVNISEQIYDQAWFLPAWEYDPTIVSMKVMIDEIHEKFKTNHDIWKRLVINQVPAISFYFLPIEQLGQTDSLYIKMNSRGKPLTDFEYIKAELEKILSRVDENLYNEFIQKIDISWTNIFWQQRLADTPEIDSMFMCYFRFVTEILCFKNNIEIEINDIDLAKKIYRDREKVKFLFSSIDCWENANCIDDFFCHSLSRLKHEPGKVVYPDESTNLFQKCCLKYGRQHNGNREFTLSNILMLYAFLTYRLNQSTVTTRFTERIRIIRNLVINSQSEIRENSMAPLLNEIEEIVNNGQINPDSVGFSKTQKLHEIEKQKWRQNWPNKITILNEIEDHELLMGDIRIIGLDEGEFFENKANAFMCLFPKTGESDYDKIKQAMLCLGDYAKRNSWRFYFGGTINSTWRELFTGSFQEASFDNLYSVMNMLLGRLGSDIPFTLNAIVAEFIEDPVQPKDWRYYFVKYPEMREGKSGAYSWRHERDYLRRYPYDIKMMNTSTALNGRHWNPFHYTIHRRLNDLFSLEDYGQPLVIRNSGCKMYSLDDAWVIKDQLDKTEILKITIEKDENGVDKIDRIQLILEKASEISKLSSAST